MGMGFAPTWLRQVSSPCFTWPLSPLPTATKFGMATHVRSIVFLGREPRPAPEIMGLHART